ncbi:SAM-dependent methyltransferase [Frankia tisae]|uniref:SAM-dependent methyltransferase n=1 Tax=Frankia tisae TaxID=2950104 RepID=UPI0027E311E3|nr:SAM-dependent methyltransferase [Frankia tisae]
MAPIVLTHARALLTSSSEGRTAFLDADLRDTDRILAAADLRDTLDLTQRVALSLIGILHFLPDGTDAYGIVGRLMDALPAGSYFDLSNVRGNCPDPLRCGRALDRARGYP